MNYRPGPPFRDHRRSSARSILLKSFLAFLAPSSDRTLSVARFLSRPVPLLCAILHLAISDKPRDCTKLDSICHG